MKHKALLITLASIALVVALAALLVSPIARSYINSHGEELIGRTVHVEKLRINIFTGSIHAEGLSVMEDDSNANFFRLGTFETEIRILKLLSHKFIVNRVLLDQPYVVVTQRGSEFNFSDIIAHFSSGETQAAETPEEEKGRGWDIGLYDISILKGEIRYEDLEIGAKWNPQDLNIKIPGVYFAAGQRTDVGLELNFAKGGTLQTTLSYDLTEEQYSLHLKLGDLTMSNILPYVQQSLNLDSLTGALSADLTLEGDIEHLLSFDAKGDISVSGMKTTMDGAHLLDIESAIISIAHLNLTSNTFRLDAIRGTGIDLSYALYADGTNTVTRLFKSTPPTAEPESKPSTTEDPETKREEASMPMLLKCTELAIEKSRVHFTDHTAIRRFDYTLSNISLHNSDFDLASKHNRVTARATMNSVGNVSVRWTGDMNDIKDHDIAITLNNIRIPDFSPYCEKSTAYPLQSGNFSFRSQNIVTNGYLRGTNHLDMFQCKAGKKIKEIKPDIKIPLRLGLYILTDKDGHIKMDIPVSGLVTSPQFSYRKIIFKAIGNLLLKVIVSPFAFLSGGDDLSQIPFDSSRISFTTEQYADLDRIIQTLRDKPELKVTMDQKFCLDDAMSSMADKELRIAYYRHTHPVQQADSTARPQHLNMIDIEEANEISMSDKGMGFYADSLCAWKGIDATRMDIHAKAMSLFEKNARRRVEMMARMRNRTMIDYVIVKNQIPEKSFAIDSLVMDSIAMYKGKSAYLIRTEMEGESNSSESAEAR